MGVLNIGTAETDIFNIFSPDLYSLHCLSDLLYHFQRFSDLDFDRLRHTAGASPAGLRQDHDGLRRHPVCRLPLHDRQRVRRAGPDQIACGMQSRFIFNPGLKLNLFNTITVHAKVTYNLSP